MLTGFKVKGFKNFKNELEFSLKASEYTFNDGAVKDNTIKTAVIYGENASGKSNLGLAMMDIITHLTDHEKFSDYQSHYTNLELGSQIASFEYDFMFNGSIVNYKYIKSASDKVVFEELRIDDNLIIKFDKEKQEKRVNLRVADQLNLDKLSSDLSLVRLVYYNTNASKDSADNFEATFGLFIEFVNSMLSFDSIYRNHYQGYTSGIETISEVIVSNQKVKDYQDFLAEFGIKYDLFDKQVNGKDCIYVKFDSGKEADFFSIMSKGTSALSLFFIWYMQLDKGIKFIFIDEFDSYFHHKVSKNLINKLKNTDCQVILTTHNTANMSNNILRPDSYYTLENGTISNIAKRAGREIRQAQNIEKMYRAGSFDNE